MKHIIFSLLPFFLALSVSTSIQAETLAQPKGKVILTVSGKITHTNLGDTAQFDREMLINLGFFDLDTVTPWTEGSNLYQGPMLSAVLKAVGAQGKTLKVSALNDYSARMPAEDAIKYDVLLAMDLNGKPMSVRDKGPLFILYPFSDMPELNNEVIHNRSVWQIKSIVVE
ncbi:molybdopterin-dependent oxidoreductase [Marinomonas sp. THO17]|uniref:molybdopterin-dependent oxidoreductase n=1 Tax=Marinomonas sp. THO17 TaxID=3149048 RepID=UPI00336C012B